VTHSRKHINAERPEYFIDLARDQKSQSKNSPLYMF